VGFSVSFESIATSAAEPASVSAATIDSYETLVMEACGLLAEAGAGVFRIGGFGDDEWPVDVAYDMSAFMEQFPPLLDAVREHSEVDVDLYSQGVERTLRFIPDGDSVTIHCLSRTSWVPNPDRESIAHSELISMLTNLAADFSGALRAMNSDLSDIPPFDSWLRGRVY
jgi:hypothetical protein